MNMNSPDCIANKTMSGDRTRPIVGESASEKVISLIERSAQAPTVAALPSERERRRSLQEVSVFEMNALLSHLLDALPQGIVIVARNLKPLYWNQRARDLSVQINQSQMAKNNLPTAISEVCHHLLHANSADKTSVVLEFKISETQIIRLRANWLKDAGAFAVGATALENTLNDYIFVTIEDCYDALREDLQIDQKKFDLTEREAQIWMLLRQEYTYQEIAKLLQISLNTVKTHVKNVYAKRRTSPVGEKFWCQIK